MNAILLNGSSRKKGNTHNLLSYCKDQLIGEDIEAEVIDLTYYDIRHCLACSGCKDKGSCIQRDDFNDIYKKIVDADIIMLGSPVYLGMPTSLMVAFLQRATMVEFLNKRRLAGKLGGIVAIAGETGHVATINSLTNFFLVNSMTMIGSDYWNIGFGSAVGDIDSDGNARGYIESFIGNIKEILKGYEGGTHE